MELANTGNNLFDPISELFLFDHVRFYDTATPAHRRVTGGLTVPVIPKYWLPRGAPFHDVVDRTGKLDPERTRHEITTNKSKLIIQLYT